MFKHLIFHILVAVLVISCTASGAVSVEPTAPSIWQGVPIMPDAVANNEPIPVTGYHYTINADLKSTEKFYLDEMKTSGWELLGKGDASGQDFKGLVLWFVKGEKIVSIDVWIKNNTTHVVIVPEP